MKITKEKKALDKIFKRRDRYELQPEYQRERVWPDDKRQHLLDTILRNWDIPKIYLTTEDREDVSYSVVDGQQRISTIFEFYADEIALSEKYSGDLGGLYYSNLPEKIADLFDDYELDIVVVSDATDEEIKDLFARLQLGMPLNAAEKLNAMPGELRNFVKTLSEHSFFVNKVYLSSTRYTHQSVVAQIILQEAKGISSAKFPDLRDFYLANKKFKSNSRIAIKVKNIIDYLDDMFIEKTDIFKNKASIVSFYVLISKLKDNGMELSQKNSIKLRDFYINFQKELKAEVEKGVFAKDTELMYFQNKINQASDSKDSILQRHDILEKRLISFDPIFKEFLKPTADLQQLITLQNNDKVKKLADDCINLITAINKHYNNIHGEEMFKPTNEVMKSITALSTVVINQQDFVNFIDALYKFIYEGSGSLSRIPKSFITDESILMEIKHLRTDAFHDLDHGSQTEIRKKKKLIASIYKKYTSETELSFIPEVRLLDFQEKLLLKLKKLLTDLKTGIN